MKIGRLAVPTGTNVPQILPTDTSANDDQFREIVIDFRCKTKTESQAETAWGMLERGCLFKEIARTLKVSRGRVTALVKFAATTHGEDLGVARKRWRSLTNRPHAPTIGERMMEPVMELYLQNILLGDIAKQLKLDRNLVTAAIASWHQQRGLPNPDGRTRRKSLQIKSSPKLTQ